MTKITCPYCKNEFDHTPDNFYYGTRDVKGVRYLRKTCKKCHNDMKRPDRKNVTFRRKFDKKNRHMYLPEGILKVYPCRRCGINAYPNRFFCNVCHTIVSNDNYGFHEDDTKSYKEWAL